MKQTDKSSIKSVDQSSIWRSFYLLCLLCYLCLHHQWSQSTFLEYQTRQLLDWYLAVRPSPQPPALQMELLSIPSSSTSEREESSSPPTTPPTIPTSRSAHTTLNLQLELSSSSLVLTWILLLRPILEIFVQETFWGLFALNESHIRG